MALKAEKALLQLGLVCVVEVILTNAGSGNPYHVDHAPPLLFARQPRLPLEEAEAARAGRVAAGTFSCDAAQAITGGGSRPGCAAR